MPDPPLNSAEATIAAIATPPGPGGIGIIRMSGPMAPAILSALFSPARPAASFTSHLFYYGWMVDPRTGRPIDEVLAVVMRAPRSYTREDVVEIHCHGSFLVLQEILALAVHLGAALAEPGEFTKRAFLNGRIDLTQAEAVIDLLSARTGEGLDLALNQLQGKMGERITELRSRLVALRAVIEVAIDFPEDDVEILAPETMSRQLEVDVMQPLRELIRAAGQGKILRDGISVIILGQPNVGKSSLLNALLKEERAIVTSVPGTTRDTIEEYLNIHGIPVRIVDTAGIRDNAGEVEVIGIERAKKKLAQADVVLLLVDGSTPPHHSDISLYESIRNKQSLLLINKIDIAEPDRKQFATSFPDATAVYLSAKTHEGINDLEDQLFQLVTGGAHWDPGHSCVPNIRHKSSLEKTLAACERVSEGLHAGLPPDLLAIDLQSGLDHLGDIIGETTVEDILDVIFEQFCIGK